MEGFKNELQERFLRYVQIATTSDENLAKELRPSTKGQWNLLKLLDKELEAIGIEDRNLNNMGYLIARIPSNLDYSVPSIGLMAHVDTSPDAPGDHVKPVVHESYDGKDIELENNVVIEVSENPDLEKYIGQRVFTSDGTSLLGADDKAGVAEIMTTAHYLCSHREIPHGQLELIFTPDEETGYGMNDFPVEQLQSPYCYTIDAGAEGEMEYECYYAWKADLKFEGKVIHPGYARGKLVNALAMAANYVTMLPRSESPEATDGRYGNYWAHRLEGGLDSATLQVYIRDFDKPGIERRLRALETFAEAVEAAHPGGRIIMTTEKLYVNMREGIEREPRLMDYLEKSLIDNGVEPIIQPIRGGTDGSRLTEMGIPSPNIFTGGHNFHGPREWVALPAMDKTCRVILSLIGYWTKEENK